MYHGSRNQRKDIAGLVTTCIFSGKGHHFYYRPRSIYQYSNMVPRLLGQNCNFSFNSQKRLGYKENNIKYRSLSSKPRSHVLILIYPPWPIISFFMCLAKE